MGFFFFRISAPYLWAVSKTFRWDFTGEFISAVSLYLFLSPFFFFFFFTFSFGQVYQRQTDKFVCRRTMMLRMNDNRFLRITCFAKCTRIMENHFQNPRTIDHSLCKLSRDCTPLKMYKFASITASFRYFSLKRVTPVLSSTLTLSTNTFALKCVPKRGFILRSSPFLHLRIFQNIILPSKILSLSVNKKKKKKSRISEHVEQENRQERGSRQDFRNWPTKVIQERSRGGREKEGGRHGLTTSAGRQFYFNKLPDAVKLK